MDQVEPEPIAASLVDINDYLWKRLALRFFYLSEETMIFRSLFENLEMSFSCWNWSYSLLMDL